MRTVLRHSTTNSVFATPLPKPGRKLRLFIPTQPIPSPNLIQFNSNPSLVLFQKSLLASIGAPPVTITRSPSKDPLTAFDIDPEQLSLHTIRDQILSKSDRNKRLFLSADDPSPSKRRRSSLSQIMTDDALDIDWNTYKDWPEGLVHEEAHMLDYFRKLKFIYLEQETKMRFLADVQDDVENGTEATVYSPAEVAERGQFLSSPFPPNTLTHSSLPIQNEPPRCSSPS